MASLTFMSYADMLFAIVPAAPPTRKNQRATSCPAPISANVPYFELSRLMRSAFWCVSGRISFMAVPLGFRRARLPGSGCGWGVEHRADHPAVDVGQASVDAVVAE